MENQQSTVSESNKEYWNELCGTGAALHLGITDDSLPSLKKFDDWYFDFYPYLLKHVPLEDMRGKDILDVGLGYGTLGMALATSECSSYTGLDIAENPVKMLNHRVKLAGVDHKARAVQGSVLEMPFPKESFDAFVSIGCLHHTGNITKAIENAHAVLRPGGKAYIMVYNSQSYRQWRNWPLATLRASVKELIGQYGDNGSTEAQRKAYDAHVNTGVAAPETEFLSTGRLSRLLSQFEHVSMTKENCDPVSLLRGRVAFKRETLLPTLGRYAGLDIYIKATK